MKPWVKFAVCGLILASGFLAWKFQPIKTSSDTPAIKESAWFQMYPEFTVQSIAWKPKDFGRVSQRFYNGDWLPSRGGYYDSFSNDPLGFVLFDQDEVLTNQAWLGQLMTSTLIRYQNKKVGPGFHEPKHILTYKLSYLEEAFGQRFDMKEILPNQVGSFDSFSDAYYGSTSQLLGYEFANPKHENWWGSCDRVAVANLNPQVTDILQKHEHVLCGEVSLSKYEIEDALSMLHQWDRAVSKRYGGNHSPDGEYFFSDEMLWFREFLDWRELRVGDFKREVSQHVRHDGLGVIIDESSDPWSVEYPAHAMWNRPVFNRAHIEGQIEITSHDVSLPILARHFELIFKDENDDALISMIDNLKRARQETVDAALRIGESRAKLYKAYRKMDHPELLKSASEFRRIIETSFWPALMALRDLSLKRPAIKLTLSVDRFVLGFPRERQKDFTTAGLFRKSFDTYVLQKGDLKSKESWSYRTAAYPPDYLSLVSRDFYEERFKNISLFEKMLDSCLPLASVREAYQILQQSRSWAQAESLIQKRNLQCALQYLSREEIQSHFKISDFEWNRVSRCQTIFPQFQISSHPRFQ